MIRNLRGKSRLHRRLCAAGNPRPGRPRGDGDGQGVHAADEAGVGEVGEYAERGQQVIPGAQHADACILQPDLALFDFGALLEGLADHILGRLDGILRGHIEVIGGGNARADHRRVAEARAGEHALEDHFLLQYLGFRSHHILLAALHFGFSLDDIDLGQGAQFGAALVIGIELRVEAQGLLLHLEAVVERHQIPIQADDVIHRGDDLLFKSEVGNVQLVLGNTDGAVVDLYTEAIEQVLGNRETQGARVYRVEIVVGRILLVPQRVAHAERDARTGEETLLDAEIRAL